MSYVSLMETQTKTYSRYTKGHGIRAYHYREKKKKNTFKSLCTWLNKNLGDSLVKEEIMRKPRKNLLLTNSKMTHQNTWVVLSKFSIQI